MAARVSKVGRNAPCPCGSGKKFKQCCLPQQTEKKVRGNVVGMWILVGILIVMLLAAFALFSPGGEPGGGTNQVWDPEHGHYHDVP